MIFLQLLTWNEESPSPQIFPRIKRFGSLRCWADLVGFRSIFFSSSVVGEFEVSLGQYFMHKHTRANWEMAQLGSHFSIAKLTSHNYWPIHSNIDSFTKTTHLYKSDLHFTLRIPTNPICTFLVGAGDNFLFRNYRWKNN